MSGGKIALLTLQGNGINLFTACEVHSEVQTHDTIITLIVGLSYMAQMIHKSMLCMILNFGQC